MRDENEVRQIIEKCTELTNKVMEVFDGEEYPVIMAVLGKVTGEMAYSMQIEPSDAEAAEILAKYMYTVKLAYKLIRDGEAQMPEGGVTH